MGASQSAQDAQRSSCSVRVEECRPLLEASLQRTLREVGYLSPRLALKVQDRRVGEKADVASVLASAMLAHLTWPRCPSLPPGRLQMATP